MDGTKIICNHEYIKSKKTMIFYFRSKYGLIREIQIPHSTRRFANRIRIDFDELLAKEIYKIDILC